MIQIKINGSGDVCTIESCLSNATKMFFTGTEDEYLNEALIGPEALPKIIEALQAEQKRLEAYQPQPTQT